MRTMSGQSGQANPILTTPEFKDADGIFPGEQWFFYWKTTPALWKSKLEESHLKKVIIPINWSVHSETGEFVDFGEVRPEANLFRLAEIARELQIELVYFIPITPCPFLPNGGLPHFLARTQSLNHRGLNFGVLDCENQLNKIYSYFDPKILIAFQFFCENLGDYFKRVKLTGDVFAIRSGFVEGKKYISFFEDQSTAFSHALEKFLELKTKEKNHFGHADELTEIEIQQIRHEFSAQTLNKFLHTIKHNFKNNYEGEIDLHFLGCSDQQFVSRMFGEYNYQKISTEILASVSKDILPSSVLIPHRYKSDLVNRMLKDLVINTYLPLKLNRKKMHDEDDYNFYRPLIYFKIYEKKDGLSSMFQTYEDLGLWEYFKKEFGWNYKLISETEMGFLLENDQYQFDHQLNIFFFHGHDVDRKIFNLILKLFLQGGKIILNTSGLSEEFQKKLNAFYIENKLKVEEVNWHTSIQNINLSEGRLLTYDGESLALKKNNLNDFWTKMISTFDMYHITISNDGLHYFWLTRHSKSHELKFEEVRRLVLYNPTSYRKKISIKLSRNFVVYKVLDEYKTQLMTIPHGVEIEFLPEGSLAIDFGVFSL